VRGEVPAASRQLPAASRQGVVACGLSLVAWGEALGLRLEALEERALSFESTLCLHEVRSAKCEVPVLCGARSTLSLPAAPIFIGY